MDVLPRALYLYDIILPVDLVVNLTFSMTDECFGNFYSNTYNILATLFKHIFDENEFSPRAFTLIKVTRGLT